MESALYGVYKLVVLYQESNEWDFWYATTRVIGHDYLEEFKEGKAKTGDSKVIQIA